MTNIKLSSFVVLFISMLFFSSCKTKKIATGAVSVRRVDTAVVIDNEAVKMILKSRENRLDYDWFSSRIKVEYNDNNISQDFTAAVRMRRDSVLWISLQGPFGIEGGRIMVTRDSIMVINKMSGEYLRQPISYLSKVMPVQTNLPQLQDFLLGYYLMFSGAVPEYRGMQDSLHFIQAESPQFRYQSRIYPLNYTLAKSVLTDKMLSQQMYITFDGYSKEQGKPFSNERSIDIKQGSKSMNLHLVFTKIKVNEVMSFPFDIDPAMREVNSIRF
jgi:hypothetical protein